MNKQAILEMTINTSASLLCMTDLFFSRKNYATDTEVIISSQVSHAQGTFPIYSLYAICLNHIILFMIIKVKLNFPPIESSQLIYFTLGFGWRGRYFWLVRLFSFT